MSFKIFHCGQRYWRAGRATGGILPAPARSPSQRLRDTLRDVQITTAAPTIGRHYVRTAHRCFERRQEDITQCFQYAEFVRREPARDEGFCGGFGYANL